MASISERLVCLPAARKRILQVLLDPENAQNGPEAICRAAGVARSTYWEARRDRAFLALLGDMQEAIYPGIRTHLMMRMWSDAMVPLSESGNPSQLIRTREQVASFLGVPTVPLCARCLNGR